MKKNKDQIIADAVDSLMDMFRTGRLPEKVAFSIIRKNPADKIPSDKWSIGNRVLQLLQGTNDARGFKQWQEVGRTVKKGSTAIHILAPMTIKIKDKDKITGKKVEKVIIRGFKPLPVFRYEDTDGAPLPADQLYKPDTQPTFFDVAAKMEIDVSYRPLSANYLGRYGIRTKRIELCVEDAEVYYHELAHAIHATMVDLRVFDPAKAEVIAEFSALVMANIAGITGYEQRGFSYIEHYANEHRPDSVLKEILSVLNDVDRIVDIVLSVSEDDVSHAAAV